MTHLAQFKVWFWALVAAFRFVKKHRERKAALREEERAFRAAERQEQHENLVDLIDTMLGRVERIVEHQKEAAMAQSHSVTRIADGIGTYLEIWKQSAEEQAHLGSVTVRSEDEAAEEDQREIALLKQRGFPVDAPRNVQLQWLLDNEDLPN